MTTPPRDPRHIHAIIPARQFLADRSNFIDPVDILVETVNAVRERGSGFRAGDVVSTGSLTLPTSLRAGQTCVARFGDVAIVTARMGER